MIEERRNLHCVLERWNEVTDSAPCHVCLVLSLALSARCGEAAQVVFEPFLGVRHIHQTEMAPRLLNINVVEIDLSAPGLSFQLTPGGPHPRPIGSNGLPMETVRQTPRQLANSIGAQIAI